MQVWLDNRDNFTELSNYGLDSIDCIIKSIEQPNETDIPNIISNGNSIIKDDEVIGQIININGSEGQDIARSLVGSVNWLLLEFEDWSMIPIENIIAACTGSPTKIAALIRTPAEAQGAAFALEIGVDALVIRPEQQMIDSATIAKSQRGEIVEPINDVEDNEIIELQPLLITNIESGGISDRYCIDLTSLLEIGEGMLIGSSSSCMVLIHGETLASEYVPSRPFRVNAGPPHAYIVMADRTTKYLSELKAGDEVLIVSDSQNCKSATIGRLKIERRPMLLFSFKNTNDKESQVFTQQAETVRLVTSQRKLIAVTDLTIGEQILGWSSRDARHIGVAVPSEVVER
ncbi:MAG: 3-dehydroquinate synthase II [Candidatus Poseidoniaceae archaeon]|nr:3-dehydroquinate synthase II [Candidatus Poseidoniaceae archaeon]